MNKVEAFNNGLARKITNFVGTMWCAYLFAVIALTSLPAVLSTHNLTLIIAWVAQTFLQLVLLSVIMVGQNIQADKTDELHKTVKEHHHMLKELHAAHFGGHHEPS